MIGLRVSYARPAILVDVAQASSGYVAENSSVRVVASLSYRFLVADALADYDSKHRFFGDSVDVSDAAALTFIKGLADSVDAVDAAAIGLQKGLADSVDATDSVLIVVDWVRAFADSVSASDAAAIGVAKALSDSAAASDGGATITVQGSGSLNAGPVNGLAVNGSSSRSYSV